VTYEPPDVQPPPPIAPATPYFNDGFVLGMYDNARWQISKYQFAAGVLLAQVAVEMGARNAFTSLLVRRDGPVDDDFLRDVLRDVSFMEEATRRLWTELTGGRSVTKSKDPPVWANYHRPFKEWVGRYLADPKARATGSLNTADDAVVDATIAIRNVLAHRSKRSEERLAEALRSPTLPAALRVQQKVTATGVGRYLRAQSGGHPRFRWYFERLASIANKLAPYRGRPRTICPE
jgi:hypothetical protein